MKFTILDDWGGVARDCADWSALEARAEVVFESDALRGEALRAALAETDVILPMRERTHFDAGVLSALPNLKMMALTGNTTRHIDVETVRKQGITLCWSGAYYPQETGEFVLGLILAAEKDIPQAVTSLNGGFMENTRLGRRLFGRTLGLIGFGNIAKYVSRVATAMDMDVLATSRSLTPEIAAEHGATATDLHTLLESSDIVSIQVTSTPETRGMIGAAELARMRPGALLVNTSRGPIVEETALIASLKDGRIRAALDVFDEEPLPIDHPLRSLPNALLTPHIGYNTRECMEMFYGECVENILAWMDGEPIRVLEV